jgi:hypothetical protein
MNDIPIEQAILSRSGDGIRLLARSPGFRDDWQAEAERLAAGFGERPEGVTCPGAVFARPLGKDHIAIVQVADQGMHEGGRPAALGFHVLAVPRDAYTKWWGDPFPLADRVPPAWQARGSLPALAWPAEPLPPRTVAEVQRVLKRTKAAALPEDEEIPADWNPEDLASPADAESPALLGGVQVLVDGGRLVFERPAPDPGLIRGLWTLLPTSTRCQLWPASFAFGNALGFDALVVPPAAGNGSGNGYQGYTDEEKACDYPQGHYELNLQIAAEAGNQADLDALFARRSSAETWRLALTLLVVFAALAVAIGFLQGPKKTEPDPEAEARGRVRVGRIAGAAAIGNPWGALGLLKGDRSTWQMPPRKEKP